MTDTTPLHYLLLLVFRVKFAVVGAEGDGVGVVDDGAAEAGGGGGGVDDSVAFGRRARVLQ